MSATSTEETQRGKSGTRLFHDSCLVVIPAANEQESITHVVRDLRDRGFAHIRVIDTGSADSIALRARAAGAEVSREPRCGFGQACPRGLDDIPNGIAWILFCNGDGSDDLDNWDILIEGRHDADLVIGSRAGRRTIARVQRLANWFLTKLVEYGWGVRFADFGPLRRLRREALDVLDMRHHGSGWNVVMQIRAVEARLKIKEVPVRSRLLELRRSTFERSIVDAGRAASGILQAVARLYVGGGTGSAMPRQQSAGA
ncbi:MAG: hypothetical protein QOG67_1838 [Verrucomicrobiota bacterium]|jgi:glycosyltransferase involved in cell wall biosynthesis